MNIETIRHSHRVELPPVFAPWGRCNRLAASVESMLKGMFGMDPYTLIGTEGITLYLYFTTPPLDATQLKLLATALKTRIADLTPTMSTP